MKNYSRSLTAILIAATLVPLGFAQTETPNQTTPKPASSPTAQPPATTTPSSPAQNAPRNTTPNNSPATPATTNSPANLAKTTSATEAGQLSTAINASDITSRIRSATPTNRGAMLTEIENRMEASRLGINDLQTRAAGGQGEAHSQAASAVADLRQREMDLRNALTAYRSADEDRLNTTRERLAATYEAYAKAVSKAEMLTQPNNMPAKQN